MYSDSSDFHGIRGVCPPEESAGNGYGMRMWNGISFKYGDKRDGKYGLAAFGGSDIFTIFFGGSKLPCDVLWDDRNDTQHIPV